MNLVVVVFYYCFFVEDFPKHFFDDHQAFFLLQFQNNYWHRAVCYSRFYFYENDVVVDDAFDFDVVGVGIINGVGKGPGRRGGRRVK